MKLSYFIKLDLPVNAVIELQLLARLLQILGGSDGSVGSAVISCEKSQLSGTA